jgi:hypothetical protein
MDLFTALRESHDRQRTMCTGLVRARTVEARTNALDDLTIELGAHAAAEERFLYVPMLMDDGGLDVSRHAMAEHHEVDDLLHELAGLAPDGAAWKRRASDLSKHVRHHLDEEEHGFFQLAGRLLSDSDKARLARRYVKDYERMKIEIAAR